MTRVQYMREAARNARLREAGGSLTGAPCGKRRAKRGCGNRRLSLSAQRLRRISSAGLVPVQGGAVLSFSSPAPVISRIQYSPQPISDDMPWSTNRSRAQRGASRRALP